MNDPMISVYPPCTIVQGVLLREIHDHAEYVPKMPFCGTFCQISVLSEKQTEIS